MVWDGPLPASDGDALSTFDALYSEWFEGVGDKDDRTPAPAIRQYVEALLGRWPAEDDSSPWADSPIINNAIGPILYLGIAPSRADEIAPECSRLAAQRGLVCFDPQSGSLRRG